MSAQTIFSFRYCESDDIDTFGLVGTRTAALYNAGIPMPKGFIITTEGYSNFLKDNKLDIRIKKLLTTAHFALPETILQIQHHIENMFAEAKFSLTFRNELQAALTSLRRSKVTLSTYSLQPGNPKHGEDFAESIETTLAAIKGSWTQHFSASLLTQRNKDNIDHLAAGLIIVVQEYIPSQKTGILFTSDPQEQNKHTLTILHHAEHGNDTYVLSKKTKTIIDRTITPHPQHSPTLHLTELHALADLAAAIEKLLYFPQELHWAIANGELLFTQTKPLAYRNPILEKQKKHPLARGRGITKSIGTGIVHVVHDAKDLLHLKSHEVVVIKTLTKQDLKHLKHIRGLIVEFGAIHSEINVILRTYGLPTIYHVKDATKILHNGVVVTINTHSGEILPGGLPAKDKLYMSESFV